MGKEIKSTTNYDMFKFTRWNRAVEKARVKKIMQSVKKHGYITSPVIINEKNEIIDGQARVTAFRELGIPVEYIVHPGAGRAECVAMNMNQTNWKDRDYIKSYASDGSEDYCRLKLLLEEAGMSLPITMCAIRGDCVFSGGPASRAIREGSVVCTKEDYERAKWELLFLKDLKDVAAAIGGRSAYFYVAMLYAYRNLSINVRNGLAELVRKNALTIPPYSNISSYLKHFDEIYNYGKTKKSRINLFLSWETERI